ncbi:MAG: SPOR domain-containing protein [Saprospiraceae bacterium]|nr:SPOR domain-containing protein [Saprospiraceae bacterium]
MNLTRPAKSGFAIQVASMVNHASMTRKVTLLQDSSLRNILVNVEKGKDGNPDYRVLIGVFATQKAATDTLKVLKKKNFDGFIVPLQKLK